MSLAVIGVDGPASAADGELALFSGTTGKLLKSAGFAPRERLTANRTYYVRTDGSNSNNGLANTSGGAFATLQKAFDVVAALDISVYDVLINLGNTGTFAGGIVNGPWVGTGNVKLQGDTVTPANTIVTSSTGYAVLVQNNGNLQVEGFTVTTTGSGLSGLCAQFGGTIRTLDGMRYGACAYAHIDARDDGRIVENTFGSGTCTIVGGAVAHFYAERGYINQRYSTRTLSGTPAFSIAFAASLLTSAMYVDGITFSGSATGSSYLIAGGGVIQTGGGGASYLPGNSAGSGGTTTGGGYYA